MKKVIKVIWILKKAFRFCFPYILVNILVLSLSTTIGLLMNIVNKNIVNELVADTAIGKTTGLFVGLVVAYIVLYFVGMASKFLNAYGKNFFRLNVDKLFHGIFMWKSYKTPQERFFDQKFMENYSFICNNTSKISTYIQGLISLIFSDIGAIVGTMILFAVYEPLLILYSLGIVLVSAVSTSYISKKEYELEKEQIKEQRFHDYYKSILTKKEYGKEMRVYKYTHNIYLKWVNYYDTLRLKRLTLTLKEIRLQNISDIIKFLSQIFAIGILFYSIYYNKYDVGTFVLLFGLVYSCNGQIHNLISAFSSGVYRDIKYLNDYYDFVFPVTNDEIKNLHTNYKHNDALAFGNFQSLTANNISYVYPNSNKNAVSNISLQIRKGEIISILGYNGSGKTTLSKLLTGCLRPSSGTVKINDHLITEENKFEALQYFGIAPQEFSHFSLSIRELVGLRNVKKVLQDEDLKMAYQKAGMDSFLSKYEMGDLTMLGKEYDDKGVDLSGGEWQKLIIASAYMGNPEVLLLDEPTASIDPSKEMEMIKDFRANLKGKTAILISHRIGFARLADRIVMMENGTVAEIGTHEELLAQNACYAKLFYEQRKLYEDEGALYEKKTE